MPPGGIKETTRLKSFKCYVKDTVYTFLCKINVFPCNIWCFERKKCFSTQSLIAYYAIQSKNNIHKAIFDRSFTGCPTEALVFRFLGSYSTATIHTNHPQLHCIWLQSELSSVQAAKALSTLIPPMLTLSLQL